MRFVFPRVLACVSGIVAMLAATPLAAHDFWIVPDAFQVALGSPVAVRTVTGIKFPASESVVAADRIADAKILGAAPAADEPLRDFAVSGKSLLIQNRPKTSGQQVIVAALVPSTRRMSADGFARYLRLESAADLAERYAGEGKLPKDSIEMRSTKYAKTLVEVGALGPRAFARTAGHPVEFVPLTDPSDAREGDTLSIRVLWRGRPLAGAHVHAGRAAAEGETAELPLSLTTDAAGVFRVSLARRGLWNVRTAFTEAVAPAGSKQETREVSWATFVFSVAGTSAAPMPAGAADSASAVAAVERFRAALARGDSAIALSMLSADAIVLESGDVETRAEYRSHHLPADIEFARAIPGTHTLKSVVVHGDAAWVSSTSITQGRMKERAINSAGAELIVLSRRDKQSPWQIRAIHWSSHRRTS